MRRRLCVFFRGGTHCATLDALVPCPSGVGVDSDFLIEWVRDGNEDSWFQASTTGNCCCCVIQTYDKDDIDLAFFFRFSMARRMGATVVGEENWSSGLQDCARSPRHIDYSSSKEKARPNMCVSPPRTAVRRSTDIYYSVCGMQRDSLLPARQGVCDSGQSKNSCDETNGEGQFWIESGSLRVCGNFGEPTGKYARSKETKALCHNWYAAAVNCSFAEGTAAELEGKEQEEREEGKAVLELASREPSAGQAKGVRQFPSSESRSQLCVAVA
ncbi:hypothetical protein CBR_g55244 [Chara braunii]|uniref:Uncharacterized protein n=1 Tax=Chara braunii TaxID=69332 RepID=A0A388MCX8_CHABU|nr:hypothetical protein CBR_g55244 [Chara braunii]|eukprot:GBG92363.1 hypothetical protein CBR_g55244 [Chara braunii]